MTLSYSNIILGVLGTITLMKSPAIAVGLFIIWMIVNWRSIG